MIKQAVIFCGGYGTRFNTGNKKILKPLVKVKNIPILKMIIDIYSNQGIKQFILLGGFKFNSLKKFEKKYSNKYLQIKAINTGLGTSTAERIVRAKEYLDDFFYLTYGDSLANFSADKFKKHQNGKNFYMSTYDFKIPYGVLKTGKLKKISTIYEKNFKVSINAGFYVMNKNILKFIKKGDIFEKNVLQKIIKTKKYNLINNKLTFWMPMDSKGDKLKIINYLDRNKIFG